MNNRIISFLLRKAKRNSHHECHRHAAAIVYKNRIISVGWNQKKSHPLQKQFSKNPESIFLHAEIDAIAKAVNNYGSDILKSCDLYVVRYTRSNRSGNSTPCQGCQEAIEAFGIKNVYHT